MLTFLKIAIWAVNYTQTAFKIIRAGTVAPALTGDMNYLEDCTMNYCNCITEPYALLIKSRLIRADYASKLIHIVGRTQSLLVPAPPSP
jgi:hypothetical protein